nr:bifunctional phosphopantothenoylcysteine decarboxylase/phosphopantothenate--cysteine ligase CoaBC [Actinomycetota bacterium]
PDEIVAACASALAGHRGGDLAGLRVLVTAGGTRECIDAVRFLGNRSSGKQGHALAAEAAARGAEVTLVTTAGLAWPVGVERIEVETAAEMEHAVIERSHDADVVVMAAAVADFRPKEAVSTKLHRADGVPEVVLEPTTDILAALAARRRPGQTLVGFAAEHGDPRPGAVEKLRRKGVGLVVGNDVSAPGVGFGHDTNAVVIVGAGGMELNVGPADKRVVARAVLDAVLDHRSAP